MRTIFFFFALLLAASCSTAEKDAVEPPKPLACHKTFSPGQLQEDFDILVTTLQEAHPDLYRVNSKAVIDKRIASIRGQLNDSLTYLEFLKLIAPLFTEIGCINTQWSHAPKYTRYRNENIPVFPFELEIRDTLFFIKANHSTDSTIRPGTLVNYINGETPAAYLEKNYALLPVDGKIRSVQRRWLETYFPNHHSNFWAQPDSFELALEDGEGLYMKKTPALTKNKFRNTHTNLANRRLLDFSTTDDIAVLTIETFLSGSIGGGEQHYESFLDSCFGEVESSNIRTLVVDLRGSGPGNMECGAELYSYLAEEPFTYIEKVNVDPDTFFTHRRHIAVLSGPDTAELRRLHLISPIAPKQKAFKGTVWIITDGRLTNAKGFFCTQVRRRPNTFFSGEECGATLFGMNDHALSLLLPNTGITVYIPTRQLLAREIDYADVYGQAVDLPLKKFPTEEWLDRTLQEVKKR